MFDFFSLSDGNVAMRFSNVALFFNGILLGPFKIVFFAGGGIFVGNLMFKGRFKFNRRFKFKGRFNFNVHFGISAADFLTVFAALLNCGYLCMFVLVTDVVSTVAVFSTM